MKSISFFFRHPHPIYFSIEKLFHTIAAEIAVKWDGKFVVKEYDLPFTSKLSSIRKNIHFVRSGQADINHITGDVHYAILGCLNKNINVLTIHDCVLLHLYPRTSLRHWMIRWIWYKLPVKKADAVTVISENTKKDLLRFTGCAAGKIRVIPNFIDPAFKPVQKSFNARRPCLLFIGTAPNKNLDRSAEAIEGLDVELIIVGYLSGEQATNLKNKNIQYRLLNKLSDQEMLNAYATADIMFFPSTYEGFGLPIIEAQAIGRVVLTSQVEPMLSVARDAACLVDPYSVDSIRAGVNKIIEDGPYRDRLIENGFKNVERFRLENVTKQYCDLYQELIDQRRN